jgi:flagellar biosynthesis component FlhA
MKSGVPPWVLIVVAGITALATLLAATISALIAYRTSKRSVEHAAEMARLDREAEAAAQHPSARRNACATYVTAGMTALRDISSAQHESKTSTRLREVRKQAIHSSQAVVIAYGR